ncbi:MAG: L-glutamate gamma-semialdehyde dehydrogenase [Clostridia bacterium]|nr:L-glutamate gamma-semialdehyde dehydrogenase [Clostridia bacterium]
MNKTFINEPERDFSQKEQCKALQEAISAAEKELGQDYPLIIDGEKVMTEKKIVSVNPCKKAEIVGRVSSASQEDADRAITAAAAAFETWRLVPAQVRADYVARLIGILQRRRSAMAAWMILETGKNYGEADGEICEAIDFFNSYSLFACEMDREGIALVDSAVENNRAVYIPIGVGLIIPPWNFPFSIMAGMAISAVLTGNTVVIKCASDSPVVAYKFCEMCEEAGFPQGVINFLPGSGGEIGDYVVAHPKTRFINFTGSREVGLRINSIAAQISPGQRWIKRVVAEMGGKNAIIVDSSANLELAASGVATAAFGFQGQKCSACSRAIVTADVYDEFVRLLKKEAARFTTGEGKNNPPMCAVISQKAFNSITGYIEQGKKEATLVTGGQYSDSKGFYIEPTVFADVPETAVIANDEIFGPVTAVIKAADFDDALRIANATLYALTGAVYTSDRKNIEKAKAHFNVGNLYFNRKCTGAVVLNHPFGGFDMSGTNAKTGTRDYLSNFLQIKSISENIAW